MKASGSSCIAVAAFGLLTAVPSDAGTFALMFDAGLRTMSNSPDTEKAIFDRQRGLGWGAGLTCDPGSRWRFGVEARRVSRDGERAFAVDRNSEASRLGHSLNLTMTEGLASVAFRFGKVGPVSPYLGVAGGVLSWAESSDIAGLVEKVNGTAGLFEGRFGLERQQGRVRLAVEGGITLAPNSVGVGGISRIYEENDLGGVFLVMKLGFSGR